MGLAGAFVASQHTPWLPVDDRVSTWVLRLLAGIRTPWLTDVASGINAVGSGWGVTVLGASVVALTIAFRRWRHLLVFLFSLGFLETAGTFIYLGLSRPRPYGVPIIAGSGGSPPVVLLTIFLVGVVYCLAVPGRTRTWTKAPVALVIAVFCLARLYLGVELLARQHETELRRSARRHGPHVPAAGAAARSGTAPGGRWRRSASRSPHGSGDA